VCKAEHLPYNFLYRRVRMKTMSYTESRAKYARFLMPLSATAKRLSSPALVMSPCDRVA
jgi:hypothetical protein